MIEYMYYVVLPRNALPKYVLEMQQYIDVSTYRDTLGSDTVSIHI